VAQDEGTAVLVFTLPPSASGSIVPVFVALGVVLVLQRCIELSLC
jgi:hypothetical protein